MNADGSQAHEIAAPSGAADDLGWGDLAWSSSNWILFVVAQNINGCFKTRLDKIRPDGSDHTQVTDGGPNCTPLQLPRLSEGADWRVTSDDGAETDRLLERSMVSWQTGD